MRTVVTILGIISKCFGDKLGKVPCYNTVENWLKKLGLSVYEEDRKAKPGQKYTMVLDESIMANKEKLLLILGIPAEHQGRPVNHEDVTILHMEAGGQFTGDDVCKNIQKVSANVGNKPEYVISDQGHNLVNGIGKSGISAVSDISHAMGNIVKHRYGKSDDFKGLTTLLRNIRLKYHLTDKAFLLPPNMRSICRFMNLASWVDWAQRMISVYDTLAQELKDAYACHLDYKELVAELAIAMDAVKHVEEKCKNEGFNLKTYGECRRYIIKHVLGNASSRRAMLGIDMLGYFDQHKALLTDDSKNLNISSDIIESTFGIFKMKMSPNKLYGIPPFVLFLPLYSKFKNENAAKTFNFKERLVNVKLKDIDDYASEHMSTNWVTERTKILRGTA